jgi:hypothetical protein
MSEYLVLIYEDESKWLNADEKALNKMGAEHAEFGQKNGASLRGGNALHPTASATSIRHNAKGDALVTDGVFIESKEALGGYYVIEAPDLDAAIAIAKQVPAQFGGVEVRPIRVMD